MKMTHGFGGSYKSDSKRSYNVYLTQMFVVFAFFGLLVYLGKATAPRAS